MAEPDTPMQPPINSAKQFMQGLVDNHGKKFQSPVELTARLGFEAFIKSPGILTVYTLARKAIPEEFLKRNSVVWEKVEEFDKYFNFNIPKDKLPLNREYAKWKKAQKIARVQVRLQHPGISSDDIKFLDYVAISPFNDKSQRLTFYYENPDTKELNSVAVLSEVTDVSPPTREEIQVSKPFISTPGVVAVNDAITQEKEIKKILQSTAQLEKLYAGSNHDLLQRNHLFAEEGEIFTNLQYMGAASIGELQDVFKAYFNRGLDFEPTTGKVIGDINLLPIVETVSRLALSHDPPFVNHLIDKTARERVYFKLMTKWLQKNSVVVNQFMDSETFKERVDQFRDANFSGYGQTATELAQAMLANHFLMKFEGAPSAQESVSQNFIWQNNPDYFEAMNDFVAKFNLENPNVLPTVDLLKVKDPLNRSEMWKTLQEFQENELKKLGAMLPGEQISADIATDSTVTSYDRLIAKAHESLDKIGHEMARHPVGNYALVKLKKILPIIEKAEGRQKLFRILVSNLAMARVHEKGREGGFTALYMPNTYGYLPKISQEKRLRIKEAKQGIDLKESLKAIFTDKSVGEGSEKFHFDSQRERIYDYGGSMIKALVENSDVPKSVSRFFSILNDKEQFAAKVLERFDPGADATVINRFFPNGFEAFYETTKARFLEDFVRGVETQLIGKTQSRSANLLRKTLGGWRYYDFSTIPPTEFDKILTESVQHVLKSGEHRLALINKEVGKRKTLKDWQDFAEKILGWDTDDMKFLRWEKFWDIWHYMGGHWGCICFLRKTVFNADVYQQY